MKLFKILKSTVMIRKGAPTGIRAGWPYKARIYKLGGVVLTRRLEERTRAAGQQRAQARHNLLFGQRVQFLNHGP